MARLNKRYIRSTANYAPRTRDINTPARNSAAQDKFGYFNQARQSDFYSTLGNRYKAPVVDGGIQFSAREARRTNSGKVINATRTLPGEMTYADKVTGQNLGKASEQTLSRLRAMHPQFYESRDETYNKIKKEELAMRGITEDQLANRSDRKSILRGISKRVNNTRSDYRRQSRELYDKYFDQFENQLMNESRLAQTASNAQKLEDKNARIKMAEEESKKRGEELAAGYITDTDKANLGLGAIETKMRMGISGDPGLMQTYTSYRDTLNSLL